MKSKVFSSRAEKVQRLFKGWSVEGCLIENPLDLFYLTGLKMSAGALLISEKKIALFVDGRYIEFAKKASPFTVYPLKEIASHVGKITAFDSHWTTFDRFERLQKWGTEWKPISGPLKMIRAIKEKKEIVALEKSAKLLWKGFLYLKKQLKVGVTEKEVAFEFEFFCRKNGAENLSFQPIIAFGKNTAYPHYRAGNAKLKKGDIVLCDLGVVVESYHSDMTRTFFFGKADPRLIVIDSAVREAHAAALKICKPGIRVGDLDAAACKVIQTAGFEKYIAHSLGHGIGLETHEFPRLKLKGEDDDVVLKEGMVVTIEPGLYLAGIGGVRHEDTVVITQKGYKNFYA
jgi:Xaa-Pro aminopeptidase